MKKIYLIFFLFGMILSLSAQKIEIRGMEGIPRRIDPRDTLDNAYLNVHYQQSVREDKRFPEQRTESEMILQIGRKVSKFSNYWELVNDSIMCYELMHTDKNVSEIVNESMTRLRKAGDNSVIIKNCPEGKYKTQKRVLLNRYIYAEDRPVFDWTITPDTMTVVGYVCKKAICLFRGRYYTVWFTPDIPITEGPWKFNGLPGLILKAEDSEGDYSFVCTALYQVNWENPIWLSKRKSDITTTREKFRKAEEMAMANPGAVVQNTVNVKIKGEVGKKVFPYNPIELE